LKGRGATATPTDERASAGETNPIHSPGNTGALMTVKRVDATGAFFGYTPTH
jgi:hypothetical protein